MSQPRRRLAAIMYIDMVGYTALGQRDEELSLATIETQRSLLDPVLARHDGRKVKTMGDALLVEFTNALEAARCAYDIQRSVREFNRSSPEDKRFHLRIGVHVGDVVGSDGDISGDAVNVASRIESLADDGGVCLTRQVYDHVQNKFELPLKSLGPKLLKNISTPLEIYRMQMPWETAVIRETSELDRRRVAVLPLKNMSPDPNDEYFADGMTEELTTALSGVGDLTVIARTSVMQYKNSPKRIADIGRELRTGSLIEGSVRKAANKVRITVQMVDAGSEGHLWSQSFDREMQDVFAIQTEIAQRVADALAVKLLDKEKRLIQARRTESTDAYLNYLKGRYSLDQRNKDSMTKAIDFFEQALRNDPDYALAFAGLADSYALLAAMGYLPPSEGTPKAKLYASRALELDDNLAEAHASLALVFRFLWDFREEGEHLKIAIRLNPNYAIAHALYGEYLWYVERNSEQMIAEKLKARELDPLSPVTNTHVGIAYYSARKYDRAVEEFHKTLEMFPQFWDARVNLAGPLVMTEKYEQSLVELEKAASLSGDHPVVTLVRGIVLALWGKTDEAMKIIDALKALYKERHMFPSFPGYLYVAMGDKDHAFEWFNRACGEKEPGLPVNLFRHPFVVDKLGTDPRWIELLHKTGLSSSEGSRRSSLGLPPALTKSPKTSFQLNSVSPRSFQTQELSRKPEALASSELEPEGTFEPTSASSTLAGMKSIRLSQHQIVGDYIRYDEVTRHKLKDFKQKIFSSLTKPTMARENYLIWAPPGSGKTFFVGQLAATVGARAHYCELNLASVSEEKFRSALSSIDISTDPILCFVDEIDSRLNQSWPYSALLGSLDASNRKGAPRVFVMAGSSGSSLDELKVKMTKASKGTDLLSRIAHGNEVQIPQMTTGDKILLTLGSLKQAGKQVGRVISEVEKVAVYYIVLQPDLNSPRRLREFAARCVERVPMEEDRVKYDNLFSAGDESNKEFWMQAKSVAPQLINSFVQIEE